MTRTRFVIAALVLLPGCPVSVKETDACEPIPAFTTAGSCFEPAPECCDLHGADLAGHCAAATDGAKPVAFLCGIVPVSGQATDYRNCVSIVITDFECQWSEHATLLCCE